MHDSVCMHVPLDWCTTYMNSECVVECRDTPTSHYNPYFYTYGNNLIPISVPTHLIHKLAKTLN